MSLVAPLPSSHSSHLWSSAAVDLPPTASFAVRCVVQFIYSPAALVNASAPFATPSAAVVEVVVRGSSTTASTSSHDSATCGLRIRLASSLTHDARSSDTLKGSAGMQRRGIVRAVRRASRGEAGPGISGTPALHTPHAQSSGAQKPLRGEVPPPCWLPFRAVRDLSWSFTEPPAKSVADASRGGCSEPHTRSATLCGVSEGRSQVEVRLCCRHSGEAVVLLPWSAVEAVVLREVSCAEALALADALEEVRQGCTDTDTAAAAGVRLAPAETSPSVSLQSLSVRRTAPAAGAVHVDPLTPPGATGLSTFRGCSPTLSSHSRSGLHVRPPCAISFTELAEETEAAHHPPPHQQPQQRRSERRAPLTPVAAEGRSYSKYARLLGMAAQQGGGSRLTPSTTQSSAHGPLSSASLNDSFASAVTSDVRTPLGGALHFPRRGSAVFGRRFHEGEKDEEEDEEFTAPDGPLSEPAGLSRQLRRPSSSDEDDNDEGEDDVGAHVRRKQPQQGETRLTLPSVVESANDGPTWFPAAPIFSDVSEATTSITSSSLPHEDAVAMVKLPSANGPLSPPTPPPSLPHAASTTQAPTAVPLPHEYEKDDPTLARRRVQPLITLVKDEEEKARAATQTADGIVFPPLLSLSPPASPRPSTSGTSEETKQGAPAFRFLTADQRRLVDFDKFLLPTQPPSGGQRGGSLTSPRASAISGSALSLSPRAFSPFRPPAALDEVLLKLRASSLPITTHRPSPLAARGGNALAHNGGASAATRASGSGVVAEATMSAPEAPAAPVTQPAPLNALHSSPGAAAGASNVVLSYREVLQQMRSRHVTPGPTTPSSPQAPVPTTTTTTPASTTGLLPSALSLTQLQTIRSVARGIPTTDLAAVPAMGVADTPTSPLARGDAVPHRAHGPFAQPSQLPSEVFLAHGSHRSSASPPSSPHRLRCLPSGTQLHVEVPRDVLTNHRSPLVEAAGVPVVVDAPLSPPWRHAARTRPGKEARLPQSPPQMLPRRPEPLIGTPKLALDQPASADAVHPPPMLLGDSLGEEEGKASSTSMAT